jgi:rhodanese-related sulfurtransferase
LTEHTPRGIINCIVDVEEWRVKKAIIWIAIAGAVAAVAFLAFKPAAGGVRVVDSAGVGAAQNKGAQIIDVRSAGEYELGHIPGAVNVPVDTLQSAAGNWDRNATYVVYCATGVRSAEAVKIMTSMGFKNIDHFAQGVQAWTGKLDTGAKVSGQKIQTSGKPVLVEFYTDS